MKTRDEIIAEAVAECERRLGRELTASEYACLLAGSIAGIDIAIATRSKVYSEVQS